MKTLEDIIAEERRWRERKTGAAGEGSKKGTPSKGKGKGKKAADRLGPLPPGLKKLETKTVLSRLIDTKKGLFGNAAKKLKKDIVKRLGVGEKEAFGREALLTYARFRDVAKKLKSAEEEKKREEAKKEKKGKERGEEKVGKPGETEEARKKSYEIAGVNVPPSRIGGGKPRAVPSPSGKPETKAGKLAEPRMSVSAPISSETSERAKRIEQLLEEQKRLEDEEAEKKAEKKKKGKSVAAKPFAIVAKAFKLFASKLSSVLSMVFATLLSIPINLIRLFARIAGSFLQGIYNRVGRFSPFGWKKKVNMLVIYSGIEKNQVEVTGITIINGAVLAVFASMLAYFLFGLGLLMIPVVALAAFGLTWIIAYAILSMMADKRSDEVEATLPDVLQIVSANISAGMTPYNALWVSARKEFGALAEEIKVAQKETLGGKPFAEALRDLGQRVRSNVLQRTVRLLIQGMKAGGELPNILQGIANDIRQMRLLQKEMAANTMSYTLFILFGMLLGAPLLFSVSIQFVGVINKFQPETMEFDPSEVQGGPATGGLQGIGMLSAGGGGCPKDFDSDGMADSWETKHQLDPKNASDAYAINPQTGETYIEQYKRTAPPLPDSCVTPGYLSTFAMIALFSVAFFGSLLIGLIRDGKQSAGLKMVPILVPATLGMFWLMSTGMSFFFNSMFGA